MNWILDAGYWVLDAGYWMLDAGCWILDDWIEIYGQRKVYCAGV
ncbi:MAG: phosphotransferase [Pseudomonadota bacterium]